MHGVLVVYFQHQTLGFRLNKVAYLWFNLNGQTLQRCMNQSKPLISPPERFPPVIGNPLAGSQPYLSQESQIVLGSFNPCGQTGPVSQQSLMGNLDNWPIFVIVVLDQ